MHRQVAASAPSAAADDDPFGSTATLLPVPTTPKPVAAMGVECELSMLQAFIISGGLLGLRCTEPLEPRLVCCAAAIA
jgi:hypothetical protein